MKVAILVDGGFYRSRAYKLFGIKTPDQRASELISYCHRHLDKDDDLYRIFYYDCEPLKTIVYHPFLRKNINLSKSEQCLWMTDFLKTIVGKRKVALRRGEILEGSCTYSLRNETLKKLCAGTIQMSDLTEQDFSLDIAQKGVDTRICLDIASLAYKHQVDKIVLIAGDSDFVPAAKHARREGIDFVLDPMWHHVKDSLLEHVDGISTKTNEYDRSRDKLCINAKPKDKI